MVQMKAFLQATVLAILPYSFAQTFSDCNPMKQNGCSNNPALGATAYQRDFTQGQTALAGWKTTTGSLSFSPQGAEFKITKLGEGPTIQSDFYIFYGYVEVAVQAAPGAGIVSSVVLQSDDLDEFDWEWVGSDTTRAQSNYFGKGNTTTYDRGQYHPITTPQASFHVYAMNWTKETTTWLVDGVPVRTLNYADAVGGANYPQTPMNVRIGNWVAGDPKNAKGTIEWAGGLTDFGQGPFSMFIKSVKVINYSPGASYQYMDNSGSSASIKVIEPSNPGTNSIVPEQPVENGSESTAASVNVGFTGAVEPGRAHAKPTCSGSANSVYGHVTGSRPQPSATISINVVAPESSTGVTVAPGESLRTSSVEPQPTISISIMNGAEGDEDVTTPAASATFNAATPSVFATVTTGLLTDASRPTPESGSLFNLSSATRSGSPPTVVFNGAAIKASAGTEMKGLIYTLLGMAVMFL